MLEYNLGICRTAARSQFLEFLYPVAFAVFLSRASQPAVETTVSRSAYPVKPHYRPFLFLPNLPQFTFDPYSIYPGYQIADIVISLDRIYAAYHLLHLFGGGGPALGAIAPNDTSYLLLFCFSSASVIKGAGTCGATSVKKSCSVFPSGLIGLAE